MSVKNYGISGVGSSVQLGKRGSLVKNNSGVIEFKDSADSVFVKIRALDGVATNDVVNYGQLSTVSGSVSTLQTEVDAIETGVGLNTDGTFTALSGTYVTGSTIRGTLVTLDTNLSTAFAGKLSLSGGTMTGNINMGSHSITSLADPSGAQDAATKAYVDAAVSSLHIHAAAQAATTAALSTTYSNGTAGVGATLTATGNGAIVIDTVSLSLNDRVVVKQQTNGYENGIYTVTTVGDGSTPYVLTRATDFDQTSEVAGGDYVFVQASSGINSSTGWIQTQTTTAIGTAGHPILFVQFSGPGTYTAGTGLSLTGTQFSVNLGAGIAELPSTEVGIDLYTNGGLWLTTNGSTSSTSASAQIGIQLNGSTLSLGSNGISVASAGITDVELNSSAFGTGLTGGSGVQVKLADTAVTTGSYGDATHVSTFTVDQQGRLTAAGQTAITFPVVSVNGHTGTVTVTKSDVGLSNVVNSLQVINAGGADSARSDVSTNRGLASAHVNEFFYATNTNTFSYSDGSTWTDITAGSATGTVTSVAATAPTEGFSISGSPITTAGTLVFTLTNDLAALEGLSSTGIAVRTATDTWAQRSIATASSGRITVTNGDGVSGNPTLDLATVTNPGNGGSFVKVTTDSYGRVSNSTAVVASDITALVDSTYVNVAGDTMTGALNMGSQLITNLANPVSGTDAANKNYVDSAVTGLTWKNAVRAMSVANITLSNATTTLDGVSLSNNDRVLITAQTDPKTNGVYIVSTSGAWSRSLDMDASSEFYGAAVLVEEGTTYAQTGWTCTVGETFTLGTDNVTFVQFTGAAGVTAGTGLTKVGNTISVNMGAGITALPTNEVGIDLWSGTANALILTTDGSASASSSGTQLALKLVSSNSGLTQTGNALALDINGLTTTALGTGDFIPFYDVSGTALGKVTIDNLASYITTNFDDSKIQVGDTSVAITDTGSNGTITFTADGTAKATITSTGLAVSTLTSGRVTFAGSSGLLSDSANLTFSGSTLTVGTGTFNGTSPSMIITATGTNGSVKLVGNGTGGVTAQGPLFSTDVAGTGDGIVSAISGKNLTVRGDTVSITNAAGTTTFAEFTTGTGSANYIVIDAAASSSSPVISAAGSDTNIDIDLTPKGTGTVIVPGGYTANITTNSLVTKSYVDTAIAGSSASGSLASFKANVLLSADGTTTIGTLVAGATITRVLVKVNTASGSSSTTLDINNTTTSTSIMDNTMNDANATGVYEASSFVAGSTSDVISAVVASHGATGNADVIVEYRFN